MALTREEQEVLDNICKEHHVLKECALGTTKCPLHSVCSLPNTAFRGDTLEEISAEFDRQIWDAAVKAGLTTDNTKA